MKYPYYMSGRTIVVPKYSVNYTDENGETFVVLPNTIERAEQVSAEVGGTITELDPASYAGVEWMDGIVVPDVPDTFAEAIKICKMGEVAYKAQLALAEKSKNEQLRADLDYVMLMGGL